MTATFNLNKTAIITRALQTINAIDLNSTVGPDEYAYASDILNLMIKKWEAQGMNLWKRRLGYLFTSYNTRNYELGTSGTNATLSYVSTTISADEASGQTTLSITSSSGMTIGDYIGIELDDGTRQWTTIASIPDGTSVNVNNALTDEASAENTVITYTTKITRPLRILRSTVLSLDNDSETTMGDLSYDEYFNMPIKTTLGSPNNFYYDKLLSGSSPYTGTLYLFPTPNNVNDIIVCTYQESLSDMTNTTDYSDFPQEWGYALIFNLACELAYHYGKFAELQQIQPKADMELAIVQNFDSDDSPIRFQL